MAGTTERGADNLIGPPSLPPAAVGLRSVFRQELLRFHRNSSLFSGAFPLRLRPIHGELAANVRGTEFNMKSIAPILIALAVFGPYRQSNPAAESKPERDGSIPQNAALPLSEVILYSSGVGYFQRDGEVEGRARVDLRFKADDINDLLKSMVVQDFTGGRIGAVTYGSRDPLTKTLKSFGLDLTENPTLGQLLGQARGERVEVFRPSRTAGTILGLEKKEVPVGENKHVETEYLNLLTDEGLQNFPMAQIQRIRLLNDRLDAELRQALDVLAAGHDTQKKTVEVIFEGEGKRKVSVAYIAQTPVWKTSYRLVLDEKEGPFLQGWAIVENTSDEDWNQVRLSLVSGRPISFTMDLYQPLYTTRPEIQPELYSSLRPQLYGDALESNRAREGGAQGGSAPGTELLAKASGASNAGLRRYGLAAPAGPPAAAAPAMRMAGVEALAAADVADRRAMAAQSVAAAAQGSQAGELFQYTITTPVNLARQKSAMLPVVSQKVAGEKVSIYNPAVQSQRPLNGFRLKNNTSFHLMQGPITVFDGGAYAGDARIDDLAPGQERLISYALDLKTEVETQSNPGGQELVTSQIKKGLLITVRKASEETTYNIKNRDQKPKSILIERPFRSDWRLVEPKQATERTREVYRFLVKTEPNQPAKLVVREEKQFSEQVQLLSYSTEAIAFYLKSPKVNARIRDALQRSVSLRDHLSQTAAERGRREQRINEISQEQSRIRENMAKLSQNSELYTRYVKKFDQQETELENLRQEIESLQKTERKQQQELNDYLLSLDVE